MSWNDWEYVWKRQKPPVGKDADLASLIADYESKHRKTEKVLFARDIAEAVAGVVVSLAIGFLILKAKKFAWLFVIALLLVLGVTAFFIRERFRARRNRPAPDASMLAKLEAEISELRHQRWLIWNVAWWYMLPLIAAWALALLGISLNRAPARRDPVFLGSYVGFSLVLFWGIWLMNRRAVRKRLDPRIEELEKMHRHLTTSSEGQ